MYTRIYSNISKQLDVFRRIARFFTAQIKCYGQCCPVRLCYILHFRFFSILTCNIANKNEMCNSVCYCSMHFPFVVGTCVQCVACCSETIILASEFWSGSVFPATTLVLMFYSIPSGPCGNGTGHWGYWINICAHVQNIYIIPRATSQLKLHKPQPILSLPTSTLLSHT